MFSAESSPNGSQPPDPHVRANATTSLLTTDEDSYGVNASNAPRRHGNSPDQNREGTNGQRPRSISALSESFMRGNSHKLPKQIGWMSLCVVCYFNVCGGPWGAEQIISSAGPLPGILGLFAFTTLWGLPISMITAELSTTFADDGGYSIWVAEAFGPFWGFQEAYWSWISGVIDTAVYPVLAYTTAIQVITGKWSQPIDPSSRLLTPDICVEPNSNNTLLGENVEIRWGEEYLIKLVLVFLFAVPNLVSTNTLGRHLSLLAFFVAMPFIVQCVYLIVVRYDTLDFSILLETRPNLQVGDWAKWVSILYWNFSGFDGVSTCAGEVHEPDKSYPKALFIGVILVLCTYAIPLTILTAANKPEWICWDEGWFSVIALHEVGKWMAIWIVLASFAGNAGMYSAEIFEDSWQLCGMARAGLMPQVFGKRYNGNGTPYVAIWFGLGVIAALIALDFNDIVVSTNLFNVFSVELEMLAFLKLRITQPEIARPYTLPIQNIRLLSLYLLIPISIGCIVIFSSAFTSLLTLGINFFLLVVGFCLYGQLSHNGSISYGGVSAEQT